MSSGEQFMKTITGTSSSFGFKNNLTDLRLILFLAFRSLGLGFGA